MIDSMIRLKAEGNYNNLVSMSPTLDQAQRHGLHDRPFQTKAWNPEFSQT